MAQKDWTNFSLQRPNYFPGQYLLDEDFELAHKYLNDRQRYINSRLHLSGIVEGLEVEAIAGKAEVMIKSGTAIDGEGNLIILTEPVIRSINNQGWLCLRFHQEPKLLQQPEILDSFTRFAETPLLTLEAIETRDSVTIVLAKLIPSGGQVSIDSTVRQYSGVRLPGATEEISLQSNGDSLTIKGKLSILGALQLGNKTITEISDKIDTETDRADVVPSEKAVKELLEKRILERLANLRLPTQERSPVGVETKPDGLYGWQTEGGALPDTSSQISLISYRAGEKKNRLTIARDTGRIDIDGSIYAKHIHSSNPMQHRMFPNDALVYQDVFEAEAAGAIQRFKLSNASYNNTTHVKTNLSHCRTIIRYGIGREDQGGALLTVPPGYDTVWVRIADGQQWNILKAQFSEDGKTFQDLGNWVAGNRSANHYCPDGSLGDSQSKRHHWLPIPVGKSGQVSLVEKRSGANLWISGVAFSRNPWAHATQCAWAYHEVNQVNLGQAIQWSSDAWHHDVIGMVPEQSNLEMRVPVVPSGRDKLLYMVEHNSEWNGACHAGITITVKGKDVPIERFLATYDNPFARHWNSKNFNRYIAAYIPDKLLADALEQPNPKSRMTQYISVKIDMRKQEHVGEHWRDRMHFRELGTHDLELPDVI